MFDIHLNPGQIGGNSLEMVWAGVPSPHQKYVNLYRVLYVEDDHDHAHHAGHSHNHHHLPGSHLNAVETQSVFKIAKIDSSKSIVLKNLKPQTRYQVWLEAYLRNGKVLQSNVVEIKTNNQIASTGESSFQNL